MHHLTKHAMAKTLDCLVMFPILTFPTYILHLVK